MQQKLKHGTVGEGQKQVELRTAINWIPSLESSVYYLRTQSTATTKGTSQCADSFMDFIRRLKSKILKN
jgi:hypothetical protein